MRQVAGASQAVEGRRLAAVELGGDAASSGVVYRAAFGAGGLNAELDTPLIAAKFLVCGAVKAPSCRLSCSIFSFLS